MPEASPLKRPANRLIQHCFHPLDPSGLSAGRHCLTIHSKSLDFNPTLSQSPCIRRLSPTRQLPKCRGSFISSAPISLTAPSLMPRARCHGVSRPGRGVAILSTQLKAVRGAPSVATDPLPFGNTGRGQAAELRCGRSETHRRGLQWANRSHQTASGDSCPPLLFRVCRY